MSDTANPYEPPRAFLSPPPEPPRPGRRFGTALAVLCGLIGVPGLAVPAAAFASVVYYLRVVNPTLTGNDRVALGVLAIIGCAGAALMSASLAFYRGRWRLAWTAVILGSALMVGLALGLGIYWSW